MKARKLTKIIRRAISGSAEDLELLLRMNARTILYRIHQRIPDQAEAQDVAQQVAMKVIQHIRSLKSPHAFAAWLQQIIIWTCDKHLKNMGRYTGRQCEFDESAPVVDEDVAVIPEAALDAKDAKDGWGRLYECIRHLPRAQYEALVMRYYDEMSYADIAKAQGISTGTVSRNISNAKRNLKVMINGEGHIKDATSQAHGSARRQPELDVDLHPEESLEDINKMWTACGGGFVIAEAFKYHAALTIPVAETESFIEFCQQAIQTCLPTLGAAAAASAASAASVTSATSVTVFGKTSAFLATLGGKVAAGVVSVSLVTGTVGATVYQNLQTPSQSTIRRVEEIHYAPQAEILFDGSGDGGSSINPSRLEIVLQGAGDRVVEWTIVGSDGLVCRSGEGAVVSGATMDLAPGEYSINWQVTDEYEVPANVSRSFVISPPEEEPVDEGLVDGEAVDGALVDPQSLPLEEGTLDEAQQQEQQEQQQEQEQQFSGEEA